MRAHRSRPIRSIARRSTGSAAPSRPRWRGRCAPAGPAGALPRGRVAPPRRGSDVGVNAGTSRESLLRAQETYADLLLEARERAPRHATLVAPDVATWQSVARRLSPDAAFIEYLVSDSTTLAFVVTSDTIAVLDLGTRRQELARLVDFTRGVLTPRSDSLWRAPLRRLHAALIAPVEATGLLAGKSRLVLVPHVELQYLPFAALMD